LAIGIARWRCLLECLPAAGAREGSAIARWLPARLVRAALRVIGTPAIGLIIALSFLRWLPAALE